VIPIPEAARPSTHVQLFAFAAVLAASACDGSKPNLREWTPEDHHNVATDPRGTVPAEPSGSSAQQNNVIAVAWRNNCLPCHGIVGRGDGPQGPMLKTRDLTDPAWQASMTDAQLATVIGSGKGKMPAFSLPSPTVRALVELIRAMRAPTGNAGTGGAGPLPPAPSAAPASPQPSGSPAQGGEAPYTGNSQPPDGR